MWRHLSEIFDVNLGADYESVARWWLSNNRHAIMNMTCAALMWSIWKLRNDLCFQGKAWRSEKVLLYKLLGTLRNWQLLCKEAYLVDLASVLEALELKLRQPLRLQDGPPRSRELVSSSLGPSAGKASERSTFSTSIGMEGSLINFPQQVNQISELYMCPLSFEQLQLLACIGPLSSGPIFPQTCL